MNAFGYDLALLAKPQGAGRMANVRKLMRLAAEFERNEGRDLRAFLDQADESTTARRARGTGAGPGRGLPRRADHDRARRQGPRVPGRRGPGPRPRRSTPATAHVDIWIGRLDAEGAQARFGLRLAFPTAKSFGVWELTELDAEEKEAEAEESCRLVYVAATRARERLILSGTFKPGDLEPPDEPKTNDTALRRVLPALVAAAGRAAPGRSSLPLPERAPEDA